jgi:hypothetical protein
VLAALDGQITNDRPPLFRSGDILIRRGAASIRANSGDVRRLFTNSIVHEERVRAVNELWSCLVEQRRLMGGVEYLYDILADSEYPDVITRSNVPPGDTAGYHPFRREFSLTEGAARGTRGHLGPGGRDQRGSWAGIIVLGLRQRHGIQVRMTGSEAG